MNIIECTIQMKKETQAHYERLTEAVTDKELKRLFSLLAAAESEHVAKLGVLMKNLSKFDVENFDTLDEKVCVYNPHIDTRFLAESLKNDPDAFRSVVREEEGTIEFFDHLSDQTESEQLKRICHVLAGKERDILRCSKIFICSSKSRGHILSGANSVTSKVCDRGEAIL